MYALEDIIDLVSEKDKEKENYLIKMIDRNIMELVYDKSDTQRAYDIFEGKRTTQQYQHLVDNYGISSPVDIPCMRLMGSRIERFVGQALQSRFDFTVTCSNAEAIDLKHQQKRKLLLEEIQTEIKSKVGQPSPLSDAFTKTLQAKFGENWQTDFEIGAQHLLNRMVLTKEVRKYAGELMLDFCVAGEMYWRNVIKELGIDPSISRCDPRDLFYEPNPDSSYIEDCRRVVHRRYMNPTQILFEFGHLMDKEMQMKVSKAIATHFQESYIDFKKEQIIVEDRFGQTVLLNRNPTFTHTLVEVFHTEWIATNDIEDSTDTINVPQFTKRNIKSKRRQKVRYEGLKINIGGGIYLGMGRSKYVPYSLHDPFNCKLSYNGIIMGSRRIGRNRNDMGSDSYSKPFSMILNTEDISNLYDITHFHINNLFAQARPGGTYTILEHIPKEWGNSPEERLLKATAYEKSISQKILALSQEGLEDGFQFNNYGEYGSNLDGQMMQSFYDYLDRLEQQADRMIGLNPQMRGEMEERDGKAVTINAVQNGDLITKSIFSSFFGAINKMLTNLINLSRISYPYGTTGAYVLGEDHKVFSIDSTHTLADYNVLLSDYVQDKELEMKVGQFVDTMITQQSDMKVAFDLLLARSISEKKRVLVRASASGLQQMQQQLQQLQQQLEESQKENEKLKKEVERKDHQANDLKIEEIKIKKQQLQANINEANQKIELENKKINNKRETDTQKIQAEVMQLYDNKKRNDEINWNK